MMPTTPLSDQAPTVQIKHRLTGVVLFEARLGDLTGANLIGANLAGAYLAGAYLAGANLAGTNVIDAGTPNGWRAVGWLQDGWLGIRIGCRNKRLAEGREYWGPSHASPDERREVLLALDYIEAVAKLRGWAIDDPAKGRAP